jgi:hypothetical protein
MFQILPPRKSSKHSAPYKNTNLKKDRRRVKLQARSHAMQQAVYYYINDLLASNRGGYKKDKMGPWPMVHRPQKNNKDR